MWREATLSFSDSVTSVDCAIVPAHPWVYGLGQQTDNRYVLWPRGEYWDVRFKQVKNNKLEWVPVADKPFANENEAWQAAYSHWQSTRLP